MARWTRGSSILHGAGIKRLGPSEIKNRARKQCYSQQVKVKQPGCVFNWVITASMSLERSPAGLVPSGVLGIAAETRQIHNMHWCLSWNIKWTIRSMRKEPAEGLLTALLSALEYCPHSGCRWLSLVTRGFRCTQGLTFLPPSGWMLQQEFRSTPPSICVGAAQLPGSQHPTQQVSLTPSKRSIFQFQAA